VKKKLTVLAFVGLTLVLLAGSAFAGSSRGARVISMSGKITSINRSNETFKVYVQMTNKPYLVKRTQTVLVKAGSAVLYEWIDGTRIYRSNLSFLVVGDRVVINGLVLDDGTIKARRVEEGKRGYR
jgi:hypothetical protein